MSARVLTRNVGFFVGSKVDGSSMNSKLSHLIFVKFALVSVRAFAVTKTTVIYSHQATCKTLVSQRLTCSGMCCWKEEGGQAMLTFLGLLLSNLFDIGW